MLNNHDDVGDRMASHEIRMRLVVITCIASFLLCAAGAFGEPADPSGHWEGRVEDPAMPFGIKLDLKRTDVGWGGELVMPVSGNGSWNLTNVTVNGGRFSFGIVGSADMRFEGVLENGRMTGRYYFGKDFREFWCGRDIIELANHPRRPQIPIAPFPYTQDEVQIKSNVGFIAGSLVLPQGDGPFPAVVMVCGSGGWDRNYTFFRHKMFLVLADQLARAGIASLRIDSRGIGESSGVYNQSVTDDLSGDIVHCVEYLGSVKEIKRNEIGLIGHSFGTMVAAQAARKSRSISYLILLSPYTVRGDLLSIRQLARLDSARGRPFIRILLTLLDRIVFIACSETNDSLADAVQIDHVIRAPLATVSKVLLRSDFRPSTNYREEYFTPQIRDFFHESPLDEIAKLRIPVLAISGDNDLQTDPKVALADIHRALSRSPDKPVATHLFPGLNHTLQTSATGLPEEVKDINETLAPRVIESISQWIHEIEKRG